MFLLGTVVNALAVILGSTIGAVIPRIPDRFRNTTMQGLSLAVILIGLGMALSDSKDIMLIIVSMVLGGVTGEWLDIEAWLSRMGTAIEDRTKGMAGGKIAESFVAASLLFCVGSMAILGAIQSGTSGQNKVLFAKSVLDGFSSVVLTSTVGIGTIFSAIPILIYEGLIALIAHFAGASLNSPAVISCMTAAGGLLIVAIGLNIMGVAKIKSGNLLPALFYAGLLRFAMMHAPLYLQHVIL